MTIIGWILGGAAVAAIVIIVGLFAAGELVGGLPGPALRERR